tara:strand:+ start:8398 stop:9885 length:1488 start_codon:yes stop_codon:yes gene_type:complete
MAFPRQQPTGVLGASSSAVDPDVSWFGESAVPATLDAKASPNSSNEKKSNLEKFYEHEYDSDDSSDGESAVSSAKASPYANLFGSSGSSSNQESYYTDENGRVMRTNPNQDTSHPEWTRPDAKYTHLNDDEKSEMSNFLSYPDQLNYGSVDKTATSPKKVHENLDATMHTILFDSNPANRLDILCSHIKKATNRSDNTNGILKVGNRNLRKPLDENASQFDAGAAKEALVRATYARQIAPLKAAQIELARQRTRQIAPIKAAQIELARQRTLLEAQRSPSPNQVKDIIVDTVVEDSSKFVANLFQLYGAFIVGLSPERTVKNFTSHTFTDGRTYVAIAAHEQYATYDFKQTDSAYEMTWNLMGLIAYVPGGLTVKIPTRQLSEKERELTPEVQARETNAKCVKTFTDQLATIKTYIAKKNYKGWYRTGPSFFYSLNILLKSVHVAEDDVTFSPDTLNPRTVASHVVNELFRSGYPFTARPTGEITFRASFADMCI